MTPDAPTHRSGFGAALAETVVAEQHVVETEKPREADFISGTTGPADFQAFEQWVANVRQEFGDIAGLEAAEFVDAALRPGFTAILIPEGADESIDVVVTRTKATNAGDNRGRVHSTQRCTEISRIDRVADLHTTRWRATSGRDACGVCVNDDVLLECDQIRGEDRRRVEIRSNLLDVLRAILAGGFDWNAVNRLAAHSAIHRLPRNVDGFLDMGDPVVYEPDPVGLGMVELAVRVGQARGEDVAALRDASMLDIVLSRLPHAKGGDLKTLEQVRDLLLAGALDESDSGKKLGGRKVRGLLNSLTAEAEETAEIELAHIDEGGTQFEQWRGEFANGEARDESNTIARMAMVFYNGPVPDTIVSVLNAANWFASNKHSAGDGPVQRW